MRLIKSRLQDNDIEMYSADNDEKSVIVERLIRTLKNQFCKYMILVSKNVYIDKLSGVANKNCITYQNTFEMKPA